MLTLAPFFQVGIPIITLRADAAIPKAIGRVDAFAVLGKADV